MGYLSAHIDNEKSQHIMLTHGTQFLLYRNGITRIASSAPTKYIPC